MFTYLSKILGFLITGETPGKDLLHLSSILQGCSSSRLLDDNTLNPLSAGPIHLGTTGWAAHLEVLKNQGWEWNEGSRAI